MRSRSLFMLIFSACMATISLHAQNWERLYTPGRVADFTQTPDGGFLLVGEYGIWEAGEKAEITKTDAEGNVEWTHRYAIGDTLEAYTGVQLLDPQSIVVVGNYMIYWTPTKPERTVPFLHKLDAQGHLLKEVKLDPTPTANLDYNCSDVVRTAQGDIVVSVQTDPYFNTLLSKIFAYNVDLEPLWSVDIPARIHQMIALPDGSILMSGSKNEAMYLCKTNAAGGLLWEKTYEPGAACMTLTQDGNVVLATPGRMIKVSPTGDLIWSKNSLSQFWQYNAWITEDLSGNLLVMGTTNANFTMAFTLGKFDAAGNLIWKKTPHQSMQGVQSKAKPQITATGGYALAGDRAGKSMLIVADTDFDLYRSWIAGSMYHDLNDNCTREADEKSLKYFTATATDAYGTTWTEGVQNGRYAMQVPAGQYNIVIDKRSRDPQNWESCPGQSATVTALTDTAHIADIGVQSLSDCPRPMIRAGIAKVRQCHDNRYNLFYYNLGNQKAIDVKIEVELPDFLTYIGSSLPLLAQDGQKLTFGAGDLDIDDAGMATIDVFCACDIPLETAACSIFRITPDTCYPTLPDWDHSIVKIDAAYDADNVSFTLKNVGSGDMQTPKNFMYRSFCISVLESGTFQLDAGASQTITHPNNALAYMFEAENTDNQPYIPGNAVMLWNCQSNVTQEAWWHTSSGSPFYDINCEAVKNSFDPNDITVSPRGDGDAHYILATEPDLNYRIRFQNTGNDTAYIVSIRDTLPAQLDIASVIPGPSSHAYTFDIQHNVLKFLFKDINLPDSSANFDASQGYVEFTVKMKPALLSGARIENRAAIYFDLNAPILTNTTFNVIHDPVLVAVEMPETSGVSVQVMPNPAVDFAVFVFEAAVEGQFQLINAEGRILQQAALSGSDFTLNCQTLTPGVYFFKMLLEGEKPVQGKLIVTR